VYRIPCKMCGWSYVGETARSLDIRVSEHKRAVRTMASTSEIASHVLDTGHSINWDAAVRIDRDRGFFKRRFKEAWHTRKHASSNRVFHDLDSAWDLLVSI
jgi:hypothetical protein